MKMQKQFFAMIIVLAIVMSFSMENNYLIIGYLTFVMPMFALSTLSYDEFDNGNAFLFTLPISRKGYVVEKYVFSALLGVLSLLLAIVLSLGMGAVQGLSKEGITGTLLTALAVFLIMILFLGIMIPLQLKFGGEKGRIAMIIVVGIVFAVGYGLVKVLRDSKIGLQSLLDHVLAYPVGFIALTVAVLYLTVIFVSIKISVAIMNKKEF